MWRERGCSSPARLRLGIARPEISLGPPVERDDSLEMVIMVDLERKYIPMVLTFTLVLWSSVLSPGRVFADSASLVLQSFLNSAKPCPPIIISATEDLYDSQTGEGIGFLYISIFAQGTKRHYEIEQGEEVQFLVDVDGLRYGEPDMETESAVPLLHRLLFDAGALDVTSLGDILERAGIDTTDCASLNFQGQNLAIVGVSDPSDDSPQLWLDVNSWSMVRLITRDDAGNSLDTQLSRFTEVEGGFLLPQLWITNQDGVVVNRIMVNNVRVAPQLDEELFVPGEFE